VIGDGQLRGDAAKSAALGTATGRAETPHAQAGRVKAAGHGPSGLPATRPPLSGSDYPHGHAQHPNH